MKLIPTKIPNVFGVKIDADATEIQITHHAVAYKSKTSTLPRDTNGFSYIEIGLGKLRNFHVLGFATKDEISFDASDVVESTEIDIEQYDGIWVAIPRFWDYELESFSCSSSDESFRSSLPKEIYFDNPLKIGTSQHSYESWQTAQENITGKLLILQKL